MQEPSSARPPARDLLQRLVAVLRQPPVMLPGAIVLLVAILAFAVQPGSSDAAPPGTAAPLKITSDASTPSPTPSPTASPTQPPAATLTAQPPGRPSGVPTTAAPATPSPAAEVAGARATPTSDPALAYEPTECGPIKETTVSLAVEQNLAGVSVRATRAAIYPIDYFRCILLATGGPDAVNLASAVGKAFKSGSTHAVLIDLWITNTSRDFGQVNLKTATVAAAGQTFSPIATLGGRAEVVISGGQGRNVTLLVAIKNTVSETTGPTTLTLDAPLSGGKETPGKYQLFLPTP